MFLCGCKTAKVASVETTQATSFVHSLTYDEYIDLIYRLPPNADDLFKAGCSINSQKDTISVIKRIVIRDTTQQDLSCLQNTNQESKSFSACPSSHLEPPLAKKTHTSLWLQAVIFIIISIILVVVFRYFSKKL